MAELLPYVDFYKIASYELWSRRCWKPAPTRKPIVLSTGMATMDEIKTAAETLKRSGAGDLTLLHCVSAYPTPAAQANLSAIAAIGEATGCKVGWSDHTRRAAVIERAVHRWGATAVEFHLDLDGEGAEYAYGHCWLPGENRACTAHTQSLVADGTIQRPAVRTRRPRLAGRSADGMRPLRHLGKVWSPPREPADKDAPRIIAIIQARMDRRTRRCGPSPANLLWHIVTLRSRNDR